MTSLSSYLLEWQQQQQKHPQRGSRTTTISNNVNRVNNDDDNMDISPFPLATSSNYPNYLAPRQFSAACRISSAKITRVMSYNKQQQLMRKKSVVINDNNDLASSSRAERDRMTLSNVSLSECLVKNDRLDYWHSELMLVPPPPSTAPTAQLSLRPPATTSSSSLTHVRHTHVPRSHLVDICPGDAHWPTDISNTLTSPQSTTPTTTFNHTNIYCGQITLRDDSSNISSTLSSTITNSTSSSQSVTDFISDNDVEDFTSEEGRLTEGITARHALQRGWCYLSFS